MWDEVTGRWRNAVPSEKLQSLADEVLVELEDAAVTSVGVDRQPLSGSRRARSEQFFVGTIRSLSPLTTRTGWPMVDRSPASPVPSDGWP